MQIYQEKRNPIYDNVKLSNFNSVDKRNQTNQLKLTK